MHDLYIVEVASKLARKICSLDILQNDVMHPRYGVLKVVYVDFKDVELELAGLLNQMRLYCLILVDLIINVGLDIYREFTL